MTRKAIYLLVATILVIFNCVSAWEEYELELFDLVDEVNQNFYEFLGVKKDASSVDVRKAYRQMSLIWHPDKSKEPDAEARFRRLVAVYEVLKDENKRKRYNHVLEFGLPDWKQPIFYYRRVRKMGLLELAIMLFGIITFGHYLVVWSVYWEKKLTVEDIFSSQKRRKVKKGGKHVDPDDLLKEAFEQIPKPKFTDLVPFQLVRLLIASIIGFPNFCVQVKRSIVNAIRENYLKRQEEIVEEPEPVEKEKRKKRKKLFDLPDLSEGGCILDAVDEPQYMQNLNSGATEDDDDEENEFPARWGEKWTPTEYSTLANKMNKFPGGMSKRWEKIAKEMERTVAEVTAAAKKMKESGYTLLNVADNEEEEGDDSKIEDAKKVEETNSAETSELGKDDDGTNDDEKRLEELGKTCRNWNQIQQKSLEAALKQYPKGTLDRWDRIAKCVPSKDKEECIQRYKYICEMVKLKSKPR